jgi:hypothetical protein
MAGVVVESAPETGAGAAGGRGPKAAPPREERSEAAVSVGARNGESLSSASDAAATSDENGRVGDELELAAVLAQGPARFASLRASSLTVSRGVDEGAGMSSVYTGAY